MGTRRGFVRALPLACVGLSGCLGSGPEAGPDADVVVGPNSRLVFEPARLTVGVGERLTWFFDSSGHNVSAVPAHAEAVVLPDGAAAFSSYGDGARHRTERPGETYAHTFEVPGTYRYVCVPHLPSGMVGRVDVEP